MIKCDLMFRLYVSYQSVERGFNSADRADRRPAEGGRDRHGLEERSQQVGRAQGQHLLGGIHPVRFC